MAKLLEILCFNVSYIISSLQFCTSYHSFGVPRLEIILLIMFKFCTMVLLCSPRQSNYFFNNSFDRKFKQTWTSCGLQSNLRLGVTEVRIIKVIQLYMCTVGLSIRILSFTAYIKFMSMQRDGTEEGWSGQTVNYYEIEDQILQMNILPRTLSSPPIAI